ncbi:MAG: hypothetical protein ABFD57_06940, partial [Smithella sp.]
VTRSGNSSCGPQKCNFHKIIFTTSTSCYILNKIETNNTLFIVAGIIACTPESNAMFIAIPIPNQALPLLTQPAPVQPKSSAFGAFVIQPAPALSPLIQE